MSPDLSTFDNSWYDPGRGRAARALWFFLGLALLRCSILPGSRWRRTLLRMFGARVGRGAVIKPGVRVKYPWLLEIGNHAWIGEDVWIDNLAPVSIGDHCCVSQGAYLCTGNHDWSDASFGLIVQPVVLMSGSWIGARAVVCPGVSVWECGVAAAGSVVVRDIAPFEIHAGNPASFAHYRRMANVLPVDQPVLRA